MSFPDRQTRRGGRVTLVRELVNRDQPRCGKCLSHLSFLDWACQADLSSSPSSSCTAEMTRDDYVAYMIALTKLALPLTLVLCVARTFRLGGIGYLACRVVRGFPDRFAATYTYFLIVLVSVRVRGDYGRTLHRPYYLQNAALPRWPTPQSSILNTGKPMETIDSKV